MQNIKKSNKYINPALISGTIKQSRTFLIVWTVVILITVSLNLASFFLISNMNIEGIEEFLSPNMNLFQFYAMSYDSDTLALGLIFSAIVAMAALLKDESKSTTEFLFSHPISRKKMFLTQLLSFLSILVIFSLTIMGASFLILAAFDGFQFSFNVGHFFLLHGGMLLINIIFGLLMYGVASIKKGKNYLSISIVTVVFLLVIYMVVLFLTGILEAKVPGISHLNKLFIFEIMNTTGIFMGGSIKFNWEPIVIWLVPAIALNIWGFFKYQRKDLNCA